MLDGDPHASARRLWGRSEIAGRMGSSGGASLGSEARYQLPADRSGQL